MCGVMTSVHADAPEGRNAAGGKLGEKRSLIVSTENVLSEGAGLGGWEWAFYTGTSNSLPCRTSQARQSFQQIVPREFLGMELRRLMEKFESFHHKNAHYQNIENYAFRELKGLHPLPSLDCGP